MTAPDYVIRCATDALTGQPCWFVDCFENDFCIETFHVASLGEALVIGERFHTN